MRLEGVALHAGVPTAVTLSRCEGPVRFAQGGREARLEELVVVRADRGVCVAAHGGAFTVDLVEHLLAAAPRRGRAALRGGASGAGCSPENTISH